MSLFAIALWSKASSTFSNYESRFEFIGSHVLHLRTFNMQHAYFITLSSGQWTAILAYSDFSRINNSCGINYNTFCKFCVYVADSWLCRPGSS
jgi:hypothetical protein